MPTSPRTASADPFWRGARLGIYRAHAFGGPAAALILFATDHAVLAGLMLVGGIIGWAGWWRDYRFGGLQ